MLDHFYKGERILLSVDGASLYDAARSLEFDVDFGKLHRLFAERARLVRAFYYTALPEENAYSPIRPLVDWLQYNGYSTVTKPTKEYVDRETGYRKIKSNMDMEIAVDALEMAPHIDHMVLISGDGNFRYLVEKLQRRGLRATVISTARTQPAMMSDDLRRQVDFFVDVADLHEAIARPSGPQSTQAAARTIAPVREARPAETAEPVETAQEDASTAQESLSNDYVEGIDPYQKEHPQRVSR